MTNPDKPGAPKIVRDAITNQPVHDYRLVGKLELKSTDGVKKMLGIEVLGRPLKNWDNTKTIIRVTAPIDVAGTALMVWQSADEPNRIFFRAAGAVEAMEIKPEQSRERLLDTDLSYEDVNFSFLRWPKQETFKEDEKRKSRLCHVIKSAPPTPETSQYAYVVSWIDRENNAPMIMEGYDAQDKLIKLLDIKGFFRGEGGWAIKEMVIEDKVRQHRTKLVVDEANYHVNHPDDLFTKEKFFR